MKIRVISEFYDKFHTSTLFKVGTVLDFDDERANDIISKKLAEPYVEPKPEPKPEVKVEAPAPKVEAPAAPAAPAKPEVKEETTEPAKPEVKPEAQTVVPKLKKKGE